MREYLIVLTRDCGESYIISTSRNAVKHCEGNKASRCRVYDWNGNLLSMAEWGKDGKIFRPQLMKGRKPDPKYTALYKKEIVRYKLQHLNWFARFEDRYYAEEIRSFTLYFIVPVELVKSQYPEAESATVSIEYPIGHPSADCAVCMISPTRDRSDYDWSDIELAPDVVQSLINCAN